MKTMYFAHTKNKWVWFKIVDTVLKGKRTNSVFDCEFYHHSTYTHDFGDFVCLVDNGNNQIYAISAENDTWKGLMGVVNGK